MSFDEMRATLRLDWERTGWTRYFPAEGEVLWDLLCDATEGDIDGNLENLINWQHSISYPICGLEALHDLDTPIVNRGDRAGRRRVVRVFAAFGMRHSVTVRDIAGLGVRLGLYRRLIAGGRLRWRVPAGLPLPTERLPLTESQRRIEDARRWHWLGANPAARIVDVLLDDGQDQEVVTTVGILARRLRADGNTVRHGLAFLCDQRFQGWWARPDLWIYRRSCGSGVDPQRLDTDAECVLVPNWRKLWRRHGLTWEVMGKNRR